MPNFFKKSFGSLFYRISLLRFYLNLRPEFRSQISEDSEDSVSSLSNIACFMPLFKCICNFIPCYVGDNMLTAECNSPTKKLIQNDVIQRRFLLLDDWLVPSKPKPRNSKQVFFQNPIFMAAEYSKFCCWFAVKN